MSTPLVIATTDDVTAPTLICIQESWLQKIGMTRAEILALPSEIATPLGGVIVTPIASWGGNGNDQRDVRSLAALPARSRRLVLVGVSEGYGGPGSLGPVTQIGMFAEMHTVKAVLTELSRVPAIWRPVTEQLIAACRRHIAQLQDEHVHPTPPVAPFSGYTIRLVTSYQPSAPAEAVASCACVRLPTAAVVQAFRGLVTTLAQSSCASGRYDVHEGEERIPMASYHFVRGMWLATTQHDAVASSLAAPAAPAAPKAGVSPGGEAWLSVPDANQVAIGLGLEFVP